MLTNIFKVTQNRYLGLALQAAAEVGRVEALQIILQTNPQKLNVHLSDDLALRTAARVGHTSCVKFLIESGANIHARDDEALCKACAHGYVEIVKLLIGAGANVNAQYGIPLANACQYNHTVAKILLDANPTVTPHPTLITYLLQDNKFALFKSFIQWGKLDIIKFLQEFTVGIIHAQPEHIEYLCFTINASLPRDLLSSIYATSERRSSSQQFYRHHKNIWDALSEKLYRALKTQPLKQ